MAVGNNGRILTSSDGATWVNRTPASCVEYLTGLTWSNGIWYATGYQSTWASADAIQWTRVGPGPLSYNLLKGVAGCLLRPLDDSALAVSENTQHIIEGWVLRKRPASASADAARKAGAAEPDA